MFFLQCHNIYGLTFKEKVQPCMCRLAEDFKMALDLQISVDKSGCTVAMQVGDSELT